MIFIIANANLQQKFDMIVDQFQKGSLVLSDRKSMKKPLLIGLGLYTALFFWFYPPICGIEDEQGFVNQTIFWSRGSVSAEGSDLSPHLGDLIEVAGRHVPMRHPGRSLITLPFYAIGGYHAIFISGYIIHLVMVLAGARILERLKCTSNWSLLLLFHPTLLLYSRTIMADASAGICLMIPLFIFAKKGRLTTRDLIISGLGVSLAAFMRHHASVALIAVSFAAYLRNRDLKSWFVVVLASLIGALPLIAFNVYVYGTIADPYSSKRGSFQLEYLNQQIPFYLESLSLFWPMMFFMPLLVRGPIQNITNGICMIFLLMLGCYYFHDTGTSHIQTMVIGLRLMQVALPTWIIGYVVVLEQIMISRDWLRQKCQNHQIMIQSVFLMTMTTLSIMLFQAHQKQLNEYENKRLALTNTVPGESFILVEGMMPKLVGIYRDDQPSYQFHYVTFAGNRSYSIDTVQSKLNSKTPVYLLFSPKRKGDQPSSDFTELINMLNAESVETGQSQVFVWKVQK